MKNVLDRVNDMDMQQRSRRSLPALSVVTIIGLVGCAASAALLMIAIGQAIVPIVIVSIVLVLMAGLIATRIRWMPLLGAGDALGTMIGGWVSQDYFSYHLTHPAHPAFFIPAMLLYVFAFLALVMGILATVQNYRGRSGMPIPSISFVSVLGGFVIGAIIVSLLVQGSQVQSSTTGTTGGSLIVHMGATTFDPGEISISKGTSITLTNDGTFTHIITNGRWINTTPATARETGAPTVANRQVNKQGDSFQIGPFTTAGTYHFYCIVHLGMNLTIIVK